MKKLVVLTLIFLTVSAVGYADNESAISSATGSLGGGFGGNFQNQLANLSRSVMAAGQIIAVIMTAIAGTMVCLGINDGKKTLWNWILGIGLAVNFGDLIVGLWSVESPSSAPRVADYQLLLKNEDDPELDILSPFMRYYISVVMQGAGAIAPYAVNLCLILAMLDGGIKISLGLIEGDKVEYLVKMILKVGFFVFLIQSWIGTTSNFQLMPALSSGFETMGYTAGGAQDMIKEFDSSNPDSNVDVQSNQIVTNALNFFNIFWEQVQTQNILTTVVSLICVVAAVIVLFLTALEMFMVRIEFWTMALLTIPLLSFGVIEQLKFLSDKAIHAMFNLATKIFVIAFIATMSVNILTGLVENAKTVGETSDFIGNVSYFLQVLLYALILYLITKKIPELVSGLLSGNPSLGCGSIKKMAMDAMNSAKNVVNAVAKGGNAVGKVAGGMAALSKAAEPMAQWRTKGSLGANALSFADAFGGKMMSMAKQGVKAGKNVALYRNPVYQGYQSAVSAMGNPANGLLTDNANANASGVTAGDTLSDLHRPQFLVKGQTASQKIGSAVNGIGNKLNGVRNKVGDFFTPPTNNDMSQKSTSRGNTPTTNASSSMTGEMQGGATSQNSAQAQRQNASGITPRTTPNMILHNLMNAENSQSSQFEGRRPYEPRGAEQATSNSMSNSQNMPSANLNNSSASEGMRQGSSPAQANTATSSAQNMSALNSTPSQSTSTGSSAVNEMRQSANTSQSTASASTGSNSTVGAMGQNANSASVNQANSVNPTTPENTAQRNTRSGE